MAIELIAKVRRFVTGKAGMSPIIARATGLESLAIAQTESPHTQSAVSGDRFHLVATAAAYAGVAGTTGVVAQVTTTAQWVIWNNDFQKSYAFDVIGMCMTSGVLTAGSGLLVQVCLFQSPAATGGPTTADTVVVSGSNGGPSSKAIIKNAYAMTTPAAPVWYTIAKNDSTNIGVTGQASIAAVNRDVRGRIIVPPQQGLGFAAYTTATGTPRFVPIASWTEVELDLE